MLLHLAGLQYPGLFQRMMTVLPLSQGSLNLLLPLAWQQYACTDKAGRYSLLMAAGRYTLALSSPGYPHQEMPVEVAK